MNLCVHVNLNAGKHRHQRADPRFPGVVDRSRSEAPDMGAGNQTYVPSSMTAISPAPNV